MKKTISIILCIFTMIISLTGCSGSTEITEANIEKTVNNAFEALVEFDTEGLNKYVKSTTLSIIIGYADDHQQFIDLGKAIFKNLSYEIKDINTEDKTVTVTVKNKNLSNVASDFASNLKSNYTTLQLLGKLNDDRFLDKRLAELCEKIDTAVDNAAGVDITLDIEQGQKNLVLVFDDAGENSVSGGALSAIKNIYK
ncbi:MAG: hypothetical protein NC397_03360 [Clostridium sp.]|nr:hypothetical protein [Clostridium sp.]